jgi:hypothetical protein
MFQKTGEQKLKRGLTASIRADEQVIQFRILDLLKNREDEKGLTLFHEYSKFRRPSLPTYRQILQYLTNKEQTVEMLQEMLQNGIMPDKLIYKYVFQTFSTPDLIFELVPLLKTFPKILNDVDLWREVLRVFSITGDLQGLRLLIEELGQTHLLSCQAFLNHQRLQVPPDIFSFPPPTSLVTNWAVFELLTSSLFSMSLIQNDFETMNSSLLTLKNCFTLQFDHFKDYLVYLSKQKDRKGMDEYLKLIHTSSEANSISLSSGEVTHLFNIYLSQLNLNGNQTPALELLQIVFSWPTSRIDKQTFIHLIAVISKEQQVRLLPDVNRRMKEVGCLPDSEIAHATVKAYCSANKPLNALKVLDEMKRLNVFITKQIYVELGTFFQSSKDFIQAQKFFHM